MRSGEGGTRQRLRKHAHDSSGLIQWRIKASIEKLRGTAAFRRGDRTGTGRARCPSSSGFQRSERPLDGELASVWRPPPLGGGGSLWASKSVFPSLQIDVCTKRDVNLF